MLCILVFIFIIRIKYQMCGDGMQQGIIEIREYTMLPSHAKAMLQLNAEHAPLRRRLSPFLGCAIM